MLFGGETSRVMIQIWIQTHSLLAKLNLEFRGIAWDRSTQQYLSARGIRNP